MKWFLQWITEDANGVCTTHEMWLYTWREVMKHFNRLIDPDTDAMMGEVICYMGDNPYGDGKPCLTFNLYVEDEWEE